MSARNLHQTGPGQALLQVDNRTPQSLLIQLMILFIFDNNRRKRVETHIHAHTKQKKQRVLEIQVFHPDFVVVNSRTSEKFEL